MAGSERGHSDAIERGTSGAGDHDSHSGIRIASGRTKRTGTVTLPLVAA